MKCNPFRLLCLIGLHSNGHVKTTQYSHLHGQWIITHFVEECSICDRRIVHVEK